MNKAMELLYNDESVIAFDIDGVLAILELGPYNHYDLTDEEWMEACNNGINYYTEDCVCKKLQSFMENKKTDRIYVISAAQCENEEKFKMEFAEKYYKIPKENIFFVRHDYEKTEKLISIKEKYPELEDRKIIMVDDTINLLNDIKEKTNFSTIHISSFIDI